MKGKRIQLLIIAGGVGLIAARLVSGQDSTTLDETSGRLDRLERRIALAEEALSADAWLKRDELPEGTLSFLEGVDITGYLSGSYTYNLNRPEVGENTGRGFDVRHNEFMANKLMLQLEKSVEYDAFAWQAGGTAQFILGQDAAFSQAAGLSLGEHGDLFQAFVEFNIPVGHGVKVAVGKYGTLLGWELAETEKNPNVSAGYQWALFEPFTHTGLRVAYRPSLALELQACVNNGWDVAADNNQALSFQAGITYQPREGCTWTLNGYTGPEQADHRGNQRSGVQLIAERSWSPRLTTAVQLDYGAEENARLVRRPESEEADEPAWETDGRAIWYGAGLWLVYDVSATWSLTLRGDSVNDRDGARTSDAPAMAPFPVNDGQRLSSLTVTLNHTPVESLRLATEARWDHSSLDDAFDGKSDQVTLSVAGVYAF